MSKVISQKFGDEGLVIVLQELANTEAEYYEDGTLEVYGEDEMGREGSATVLVSDIANETLDVIERLRKKEEILDLIINQRIALTPHFDGGWNVQVYGENSSIISEADRFDLGDAIKVAVFRASK